ncbi:hypothetical protein CWC39_04500 [Corynebacterium heidelbergense]|uniref:Uncharacterized protein n=1 Tax=Corynebacterium heidelbergense TaxID=2055947 RepID=A0A364VC76_9CORY|nr:hypothetical protein CWC39_04500 [Corynebacterium heidelbergense]
MTSFRSALLALVPVILTPTLILCLVGSVFGIGLLAILYPSSYLTGAFTFLILPLGSGLLGALTWPVLSEAWSVVRFEHKLASAAYIAWMIAIVTLMSCVALVGSFHSGMSVSEEVRRFILFVFVGICWSLTALLIQLLFGRNTSIIITVIHCVFTITIGGDVLAETVLWLGAFQAWPETALSWGRFVIATPIALGAAGAVALLTHRLLDRVSGKRYRGE